MYAIEEILAINGAAIVEDGTKFVQVVMMPDLPRVKKRAPQPDPNAKLIDPIKVPFVGSFPSSQPPTPIEKNLLRMQKALYDFVNYQKPPERPAARLLELYATVTGTTAQSSKQLDSRAIQFRITTPLSQSELKYAIEATFALNGLAIIPVGDAQIRLGSIAEVPQIRPEQDAK